MKQIGAIIGIMSIAVVLYVGMIYPGMADIQYSLKLPDHFESTLSGHISVWNYKKDNYGAYKLSIYSNELELKKTSYTIPTTGPTQGHLIYYHYRIGVDTPNTFTFTASVDKNHKENVTLTAQFEKWDYTDPLMNRFKSHEERRTYTYVWDGTEYVLRK